jgi:glycosyltransferase involved in cell wall biosynthesis
LRARKLRNLVKEVQMPSISLKSLSEPDAAASPAPRIGIVIAHLGSGGAEKAAVVLANGLADRGYFVDLLTWQAAAFHLKDMSPKVTRIDLSAGRRPNTTQVIASLVRYLLQKQPAIIFPHLEKPSLLVIAGGLLTGYRRIVPCIQIDLIAYAAIHHNRRHRLRRGLLICLVAVLYRLTPRVVAVSEGAAQTARRLLSPFGPPVQVIYNGLDYPGLASKAQQQVEEAWLLQRTVPVIVTCGRLTQQKAQDTLLRAFAELRRAMPVRLVILGEGEEHEALLALARQLGVAQMYCCPELSQIHRLVCQKRPLRSSVTLRRTSAGADRGVACGRSNCQYRLPLRTSRSLGARTLWHSCTSGRYRGAD